jgi:hypothetical protein
VETIATKARKIRVCTSTTAESSATVRQ